MLRHSYASLAALLGHKGHSVTRRYIHAADAAPLATADVVAERTMELMAAAADRRPTPDVA